MAKTYALELNATNQGTQVSLDGYAHSILFADSIQPVYGAIPDADGKSIIVTSNVENTTVSSDYQLLANDSQSEVTVDISTGKFVEGNLIACWAPLSEAQADLRDFITYFATAGDIHLHVGVCNTTQSQDYTPEIVANSRPIKMMSPSQVQSLGL